MTPPGGAPAGRARGAQKSAFRRDIWVVTQTSALRRRHTDLAALANERFDILVIGGGSIGAGIAVAASARGLRVALVEKDDFGSGTSSRSTKLAHGGVRYLERAVTRADLSEYRLVREALRERAAFFRLAPYLSRPIAILAPAYSARDRLYYSAGLRLYDLLSGSDSLGRTRYLRAAEAQAVYPALDGRGLSGAVLYYDGQFDDARLNVALAVTAGSLGATVVNHACARRLVRAAERIAGAEVEDTLTGDRLTVRAAVVINAAGPQADAVRALADPGAPPLLQVSRGIHLVLGPGRFPGDTGLLIPKTPDGRVVFILPWLGHTLIGTTDGPAEPSDHPPVPPGDIDYLLQQVNRYLVDPVARSDIRSTWSGLRPLVRDPRRRRTAELSRTHVITQGPGGLVTVVGGKWTTYRRIAEDAVTTVVRGNGLAAGSAEAAREQPIIGTQRYSAGFLGGMQRRYHLDADVAAHLGQSYGARMEGVCALMEAGHGRTLATGHPYVEAEVLWAVREEFAQTVMDVLARRTRLAFLDRAAARLAMGHIANLMAVELGWSETRRATELAVTGTLLDGDL